MIQASCHCGAVRLEIARKPSRLTECNCSTCGRYGARWAYYPQKSVKVIAKRGSLKGYSWGDRTIAFMHCTRCGCLTHYDSVKQGPDERRAVNARMMDPAVVEHLPVRRFDGADTWSFLD